MASGDKPTSEFGYVSFNRTRDFQSYCRWNQDEVKAYAATLPPRPINACLFLFQSHVCILCDFPCANQKKHVGDYIVCKGCWSQAERNNKNSQGARHQRDANGNIDINYLPYCWFFLFFPISHFYPFFRTRQVCVQASPVWPPWLWQNHTGTGCFHQYSLQWPHKGCRKEAHRWRRFLDCWRRFQSSSWWLCHSDWRQAEFWYNVLY